MKISRVKCLHLLLVVGMVLAAGCITQLTDGKNNSIVRTSEPGEALTQEQLHSHSSYSRSIYWISIDSIPNKHVGDVFPVKSTTNLSAGGDVHYEILSARAMSVPKMEVSGFYKARGVVKIIPGNNGINTFSFTVNSSTFNPDEYLIIEFTEAQQDLTGIARFNLS
jgi:hypothetical protein